MYSIECEDGTLLHVSFTSNVAVMESTVTGPEGTMSFDSLVCNRGEEIIVTFEGQTWTLPHGLVRKVSVLQLPTSSW